MTLTHVNMAHAFRYPLAAKSIDFAEHSFERRNRSGPCALGAFSSAVSEV
jgi:hypothetical protein